MVFDRRTVLVLDAGRVAAARVARGPRAVRLTAYGEAPLSAGALLPSPVEENLVRSDEVRSALERALTRLARNGRRATLVLPDAVARPLLVEPPAGVDPRDFARFRLAPGLPFAPAEAIVDGLRVGEGRFLAAAARRRIVRSYELLAEACGLVVDRVGFAGLSAVAGFLSPPGRGTRAAAVVGDAAVSFAVFRDDALVAFRTRLRDAGPGEAARIRDDLLRTALLGGIDHLDHVFVVGPGSPALAVSLSGLGLSADAGWGAEAGPETAESLWPGAAIA
jgi:hypothetical protein